MKDTYNKIEKYTEELEKYTKELEDILEWLETGQIDDVNFDRQSIKDRIRETLEYPF